MHRAGWLHDKENLGSFRQFIKTVFSFQGNHRSDSGSLYIGLRRRGHEWFSSAWCETLVCGHPACHSRLTSQPEALHQRQNKKGILQGNFDANEVWCWLDSFLNRSLSSLEGLSDWYSGTQSSAVGWSWCQLQHLTILASTRWRVQLAVQPSPACFSLLVNISLQTQKQLTWQLNLVQNWEISRRVIGTIWTSSIAVGVGFLLETFCKTHKKSNRRTQDVCANKITEDCDRMQSPPTKSTRRQCPRVSCFALPLTFQVTNLWILGTKQSEITFSETHPVLMNKNLTAKQSLFTATWIWRSAWPFNR